MCFKGQTLSAYVDGELDTSQCSEIEVHLELCDGCRKKVDLLNSLKGQFELLEEDLDSFTSETVWTRLSHSTSPNKGLDFWHRGVVISPSLMISFSFLFIAVLGFGIYFTIPRDTSFQLTSDTSGSLFNTENFPLEIPIDNVEKILSYFDIHDEPLEIFIQLPSTSDFFIQGEPLFLKKNDYIAGR
jgi:hypothetical protein